MVLITGFFRDSGRVPIDGGLTFKLDAPISDNDSIYITQPRDFAIVAGQLPLISGGTRGIEIPETQTKNVTYEIILYQTRTETVYYLLDGVFFDGVVHQWTDGDGFWYTGSVHSTDSRRVDRVERDEKIELSRFNTIIPNVATIDFDELIPTQIATDKLPTTLAQLAELLVNTPQYRQAISANPKPKGIFDPNVFYSQDDWVEFNGSSYVYVNRLVTRGNYPPSPSVAVNDYWQLWAAKGDTGTGTAGNTAAYNATAWNNQTDAPSRGAVRNVIETLATQAQLNTKAPIDDANLVRPLASANPAAGDRTRALATTQWVGNEFATINNANLTGNISVPLQATNDRSNRPASTQFVDNYGQTLQMRPLFLARKTSSQTLTNSTPTFVTFETKDVDTNNAFNLGTSTFTVPAGQSGWYEFVGQFWFERSGSGNWSIVLDFVLAGQAIRAWGVQQTPVSGILAVGSAIVYLTDGATVRPRVDVTSSGTVTLATYAGVIMSQFSGKRLPMNA